MASEYDVDAIKRMDGENPFDAITHVCVRNYDGNLMPIPVADVIEGIRCGRFAYYVSPEGNKRQPLRVARSPYNKFYLKTDLDRQEPKTLLALPDG